MRRLAKIAGWCGMAVLGWLAGQAQLFTQAQESIDARSIVAHVNGVPITRQELGEELIARKGREQLKLLINRRIIEQACQKAGVTVTDAEVEQDVKDVMKSVNAVTAAQFEETVLRQRKMTLADYKEDVVRPGIMMKKLAGQRVKVTEEEVQQAYAAKYGEKVRCRVILVPDQRTGTSIHAEVKNDRAAFLRYARQQADPQMAAMAGEIRINRFSTLDNIEKAAFELKDGEVSHVLQVRDQGWAILLREALEPADASKKFADVRDELHKEVLDRNLRQVVPEVFKELRDQAVVRDYLNNKFDIKEAVRQFSQDKPAGPASAKSGDGK